MLMHASSLTSTLKKPTVGIGFPVFLPPHKLQNVFPTTTFVIAPHTVQHHIHAGSLSVRMHSLMISSQPWPASASSSMVPVLKAPPWWRPLHGCCVTGFLGAVAHACCFCDTKWRKRCMYTKPT